LTGLPSAFRRTGGSHAEMHDWRRLRLEAPGRHALADFLDTMTDRHSESTYERRSL
jgi:hypothetical protein